MTAPTDRVWLEVEPGSEPISGNLRDSGGRDHRFRGWLELAALLERERTCESAPTAHEDDENGKV